MEQNDANLDSFIRSHLQGTRVFIPSIEPSPDFTARTLAQIIRIERRRRSAYDIFAVGLSIMPVVLHQGWWHLAHGRDFFAVSSWPMGDYLVGIYQILLSSLGLTLLVIVGILTFVSYLMKFRRTQHFSKIA